MGASVGCIANLDWEPNPDPAIRIFACKKKANGMRLMIMEMDTGYFTCDDVKPPSKSELEQFSKKFRLLSKDELEKALVVPYDDFIGLLNQMVPCVGCRRSSENMYSQVIEWELNAFNPIQVTKEGNLQLRNDKINSKFLCSLFHIPSTKVQSLMDSLSKCKSGRRCTLHSMESQRIRTVSSWVDVWDYMDDKCQERVVLIEAASLVETLDRYLRKHRFCTECKSKVLKAYHILIGEVDSSTESGYIPSLYEGIRCCKDEKHIHVMGKTDFVSRLIAKAVPELVGRERHAKTMEIAQEEVLTCLGLCIFERLHRIQQRFKEEERTWEIIMCIAAQAFRRSFEMAVERKLGISQLELLCEELTKEYKLKLQRKETKKQKKRKKKERKAEVASQEEEPEPEDDEKEEEEKMEREEAEMQLENQLALAVNGKKSGKSKRNAKAAGNNFPTIPTDSLLVGKNGSLGSSGVQTNPSSRCSSETSRDCGYSSGNNATCSSPDGFEIMPRPLFSSIINCQERAAYDEDYSHRVVQNLALRVLPLDQGPYKSLEEQLESSCSSDEDFDEVPEEDRETFLDPLVIRQRELFRKNMRLRFEAMFGASKKEVNGSTRVAAICEPGGAEDSSTSKKSIRLISKDDEKSAPAKENKKPHGRQNGPRPAGKKYKGKNRR